MVEGILVTETKDESIKKIKLLLEQVNVKLENDEPFVIVLGQKTNCGGFQVDFNTHGLCDLDVLATMKALSIAMQEGYEMKLQETEQRKNDT